MITTLFLITLTVIAIAKVNKDTVKSKGPILLCSICIAQFFDYTVYEAKIDGLRERIAQLER